MRRHVKSIALSLVASILLHFPIPTHAGAVEQTPAAADAELLRRLESLELRHRRAQEELEALRRQLAAAKARRDGDERDARGIRHIGAKVLIFPLDVIDAGAIQALETTSDIYVRLRQLVRRLTDGNGEPVSPPPPEGSRHRRQAAMDEGAAISSPRAAPVRRAPSGDG